MNNINPRALAALAADQVKRNEADQAKRRETARKNELAAYIRTVTSSVPPSHGERLESEAQIANAHRRAEQEYFAQFGIMNDEKVSDDTLVQAPMPVLRRMAREFANAQIRDATERQRMAALRQELIKDSNDVYELMMEKCKQVLSGLGDANLKTNFAVNKRIIAATETK